MKFTPKYTVTPAIAKALASIEMSRKAIVEQLTANSKVEDLREAALIATTHHSTAIEGNQLSLAEVSVIVKSGKHFLNQIGDESEVYQYYKALEAVERLAHVHSMVREQEIQLLHGLAFAGQNKATPYREGPEVIRAGKHIVYIPPIASNVPRLMGGLVEWINCMAAEGLPVPIIAGMAHYQLATIHPYSDGNGRTARLLTMLILHKYGYGLGGVYCLDEYYSNNLAEYYIALTVGINPHYHDGKRSEADLSEFLEYFVIGMAEALAKARSEVQSNEKSKNASSTLSLRDLTNQQKRVLRLFVKSKEITAKEIATFFKVGERQARYLCQQLVVDGLLEISDPAPKTRKYRLMEKYEALVVG